jgi:hypothetical protein
MISETAVRMGDKVVRALKDNRVAGDFSEKGREIAGLFDEKLWNGSKDATTDFKDGTPNLRIIEETEFKRHMGEKNKDESLKYPNPSYVDGYFIVTA